MYQARCSVLSLFTVFNFTHLPVLSAPLPVLSAYIILCTAPSAAGSSLFCLRSLCTERASSFPSDSNPLWTRSSQTSKNSSCPKTTDPPCFVFRAAVFSRLKFCTVSKLVCACVCVCVCSMSIYVPSIPNQGGKKHAQEAEQLKTVSQTASEFRFLDYPRGQPPRVTRSGVFLRTVCYK